MAAMAAAATPQKAGTDMAITLVLTRGIPASGKTTWAKAWVEDSPLTRTRINRDDFRHLMYDKYWDVDEQAVTKAQHAAILALLKSKKDVVVDDTNLKAANFKALLRLARSAGAEVIVKDFNIDVDVAYQRDNNRERSVGPDVILNFERRYLKKGKLPAVPTLDGEAMKFAPYEHNPELGEAIIVDIDGTLAHMVDRGPYDTSRYHTDKVDPIIKRLVSNMKSLGHRIIVVSGRDAAFKEVLKDWLWDHNIVVHEIHMRPEGDTRNDAIIKDEIYENEIKGRYNIEFVLDDRDRVVAMWRAKGVKTLQVEYGDF